MSRYFIFLQYKGTRYHGWQVQPNAITVQQVLDEKLSILLGEKIETTGAGRTDTGVHAKVFAAHLDTSSKIPDDKAHFLYKINSLLPFDISVYNIIKVKKGSHARFDATSRTYEYHITQVKDPFQIEFAYFFSWKLNIDKMNEASERLFHYIDFTSFSKLHTDVKTNNCKILEAHWKTEGNKLIFTIAADRFLRNMVRAIVGTMLEVGKEKISISEFDNIFERKDRCSAGVSAPAHGLYLTNIEYPDLEVSTK
jgi:tRNA pseudouridine38-40 synthase